MARLRFPSLYAALALLTLTAATSAHADEESNRAPPEPSGAHTNGDGHSARAHRMYIAGKAAYEAGDYVTAIREWKKAQMLAAAPGLDYNLGLAYQRLERPHAAVRWYRHYLEEQPTASNRSDVERDLATLEPAARADRRHTADGEEVAAELPEGEAVASVAAPERASIPAATPYPANAADPANAAYPTDQPRKKHGRWLTIGLPILGGVVLTAIVILYYSVQASSSSTPPTDMTTPALRMWPPSSATGSGALLRF